MPTMQGQYAGGLDLRGEPATEKDLVSYFLLTSKNLAAALRNNYRVFRLGYRLTTHFD